MKPAGSVCLSTVALFVLSAQLAEAAFVRTEERERCASYEVFRQPFFGATHLHTGLSFDGSIRFVETRPRDVYKFAKGEGSLTLPGPLGEQTREVEIDVPLDFGAVTDHSELFGEIGICKDFLGPNAAGRLSLECRLLNGFYWHPESAPVTSFVRDSASSAFAILSMPNIPPSSRNTRLPLCETGGGDCDAAELAVWAEMQAAAEEAYDRTSDCAFTSFVAYENASTPSGSNWHRNVIFRNDKVIERPITAIDLAAVPNTDVETEAPLYYPFPNIRKLWDGLQEQCIDGNDGCDVLTIPHNSNLGGPVGSVPPMFFDPIGVTPELQREHALLRQAFEPLVEIYQSKGSSECRWDPRYGKGVETKDEDCAFELLDSPSIASASGIGGGASAEFPPSAFSPRAYVRNVLKDGLAIEDQIGANPFKLGIIASSDSHNGTMGWHPETEAWPGHLGVEDAIPTRDASTIQNSSGGHTVVWAEENSRDSIFEAMKRRETYGTSGTRPIVRFFGGWGFDDGLCGTDFVRAGYLSGVPMGGDLPTMPQGDVAPRFVTAAWMDDFIGTPLQQIQIIKGWVDRIGETHEAVYTVAGKRRAGRGSEQLCAVWQDPDFDPDERAMYYVRVLEEPVPRYSTLWCQTQFGLDPLKPKQCRTELTRLQNSDNPVEQLMAEGGGACCSNETTAPLVQPMIQERAWTSPIWYNP
jgi:hypothetical protein